MYISFNEMECKNWQILLQILVFFSDCLFKNEVKHVVKNYRRCKQQQHQNSPVLAEPIPLGFWLILNKQSNHKIFKYSGRYFSTKNFSKKKPKANANKIQSSWTISLKMATIFLKVATFKTNNKFKNIP